MNPPERERGGEDHHIARLKQVHGVLVSVEADEAPLRRNIHLSGDGSRQVLVARGESIVEHVGHGHQLDWATRRGNRVYGRSTASTTATHQRDLN